MLTRFLTLLALFAYATTGHAFVTTTKWPQPNTTLYLNNNLSSSSPSGVSWRDAFTEAASTWTNATNFTFNLSDTQVASCSTSDLRNFIGFAGDVCGDAWGDTTLGVTITATFANTPAVTAKTDVLFNDGLIWDVYHGNLRASHHDFRRTAVHELGHVLGLDHETGVSAIMAPYEGNLESPTADDLSGIASLYGASSDLPPILLTLETPSDKGAFGDGSVLNGISNVQGWVAALASINRVEFYVDNKFIANIPFNGSRGDVAQQHPEYPNAAYSGFSMAWNYALFEPGPHTILVRAIDIIGRSQEVTRSFNTVEFNNTEFFPDSNKIDLRNASARFPPADRPSYQMAVDNAIIDGRRYSILFAWVKESQRFEIYRIQPIEN